MNRGKVLIIGCGRAGNRMVSKLKDIDKRYTNVLFVNSSLNDMINLPHYSEDNSFVFGNDGSGKDKERSKRYVTENINGIADTVLKYGNIKDVFIMASSDGGSGSTFSIALANLIKKLTPDKFIHMVTITPDPTKVDRISLENCLDTWNQIINLYDKKVVQTIRIIDNSTYNSYEEVNEQSMRDFDSSFNLIGSSTLTEETIDLQDQIRILRTRGYILSLRLASRYNNVITELNKSIKASTFAMPSNFNCDFLGVNVVSHEDIRAIRESVEVFEATYSTSSVKDNGIVVMSGMDIPVETISLIKMALEEKESRAKDRVKNSGIKIDLNKKTNDSVVNRVAATQQPAVSYTSSELDDLLSDITDDLF